MKNSTKKLVVLSCLTALSLITFMVESLFPPLMLPGAKMGLSNIFSTIALVMYGPLPAIIVVCVRTVLGSMFTGGLSTLLYSLSAGLVSIIVSGILVQLVYPRISIVAVSIVSAVVHNLVQNVVFCMVTGTYEMYAYAPWLAVIGVVSGLIVGVTIKLIIKGMPYNLLCSVVVEEVSEKEVSE